MTRKPKIKGLNSVFETGREKITETTQQKNGCTLGRTVVDDIICKPQIKGSNPATANKRKNRTEKVWQKMVVPQQNSGRLHDS